MLRDIMTHMRLKNQRDSQYLLRDAEIPLKVTTGKYIITIISVLITNDMFSYF